MRKPKIYRLNVNQLIHQTTNLNIKPKKSLNLIFNAQLNCKINELNLLLSSKSVLLGINFTGFKQFSTHWGEK